MCLIRNIITFVMAVLIVTLKNVLKAVLYIPAMVYLFVVTYLIRAYVNAIIKLMKVHKFMFKHWISHYYKMGPSVMLIKDEVEKLKTVAEAV